MSYIIRPAVKDDEPFLWEMLYYAAHVDEEGEKSIQSVRENAGLVKYVRGWGRATDVGCIALDAASKQPIGAAWIRLLLGDEKTVSYVDDHTPELAIAVSLSYLARDVGTLLLTTHILGFPARLWSYRRLVG